MKIYSKVMKNMMIRLLITLVLLTILALPVLGSVVEATSIGSQQAASTVNDIGYPFPCDQTWRVYQGYNGATHKNYYAINGGIDQRYAFDLVKDMADTAGAEVIAAASGIVTTWVPDDGGAARGMDVFIHLSDGNIIYNAHLTDLKVSDGQWVNKGDPIGKVFDYNGRNVNHLHFHVGTRPQSLPLNFGVWSFPSPGPVGSNGEWSGSKIQCSPTPPTADAGGPYTANEGETIMLNASGSSGMIVSYEWDLDGDGEYDDATGQTPSWTWPDDYAGSIGLKVTGDGGATDIDTTRVTISNVAPTVKAGPDQIVYRNDDIALSCAWTDPAGSLDELYIWEWDVTGDGVVDSSGSASYGSIASASTSFPTEGTYTLTCVVKDKDGGVGSDSIVVEVLNQPPDCSSAAPSIATIWPPNHKFVLVNVLGVTDPEGDPVSITIDSIEQDEPVDTVGDGRFRPDSQGVGTETATSGRSVLAPKKRRVTAGCTTLASPPMMGTVALARARCWLGYHTTRGASLRLITVHCTTRRRWRPS